MKVMVPVPDKLITKIPLFVLLQPLKRPRSSPFGSMRQPKANQRELRAHVKGYAGLALDYPVFTQVFVNWMPPDLKNKKRLTVHPTKLYHGDLDNLDKAVNDALVEASIILDDRLIVGTLKTKAYGPENLVTVAIFSVKQEPIALEDVWTSSFVPTNKKPSLPQ